MDHQLVRLSDRIEWAHLERELAAVFHAGVGHPALPARLMAGLLILKHMHALSDKALCARWIENPYFQYFCGEQVFRHELGFDRSSLSRWRRRLGAERLTALIEECLRRANTDLDTGLND
jgi:IS5 family transposase